MSPCLQVSLQVPPAPDLLDEVDAGLEVQAEVDEGPLDALQLVLLLLQHEHVVVEELLQLLVGEVDAQLLKVVELEERERDTGESARVRPPVCLPVSVSLSRGWTVDRKGERDFCRPTSNISKPAMSSTPMKY